MRNHLWCPNDHRGQGIDDDDEDEEDDDDDDDEDDEDDDDEDDEDEMRINTTAGPPAPVSPSCAQNALRSLHTPEIPCPLSTRESLTDNAW